MDFHEQIKPTGDSQTTALPSSSSVRSEDEHHTPCDEGWKELMGRDLLLKTLNEDTVEEANPVQAQDAVIVDFVGRFAETKNDEDGPVFHVAKDWLIVIAEKDVTPALELGIRFMNVGDRAVIWSHSKFAYGPLQRKQDEYCLPPHANVRYEVCIKSLVPHEKQLDPLFLIQSSKAKKAIGNDAYANEWSKGLGRFKVLQLYKRGAETVELIVTSTSHDESVRNEAKQVMLDCLNNIVAVHMRAKQYHEAKEAAVRVLSYDPDNFKALIRAAKAALLDPSSSFDEVEAALEAAERRASNDDPDLQRLRVELKQRKHDYKQRSKEMYSKIVNSSKKLSSMEVSDSKEDRSPLEQEDVPDVQSDFALKEERTPFDWKKELRQTFIQALAFIIMFMAFQFFNKWQGRKAKTSDVSSISTEL